MKRKVDISFDDLIKNNKNKNRPARGGNFGGLQKNLAQRSGLSRRGDRETQNKQSPRLRPPGKQEVVSRIRPKPEREVFKQDQSDPAIDLLDEQFKIMRNKLTFSCKQRVVEPLPSCPLPIHHTTLMEKAENYYSNLGQSLDDFYIPEKNEINLNFFRFKKKRNIICLPLLEARVDEPENKLRTLKKKVKVEKKYVERQIRKEFRRKNT